MRIFFFYSENIGDKNSLDQIKPPFCPKFSGKAGFCLPLREKQEALHQWDNVLPKEFLPQKLSLAQKLSSALRQGGFCPKLLDLTLFIFSSAGCHCE